MGLFQNIISSIGNGISDVFGGGDSNDQPKKKQNTPNAPTANNNLTAQKINMPKTLVNAPRPVIPIAAPAAANTANLTAQSAPIPPLSVVAPSIPHLSLAPSTPAPAPPTPVHQPGLLDQIGHDISSRFGSDVNTVQKATAPVPIVGQTVKHVISEVKNPSTIFNIPMQNVTIGGKTVRTIAPSYLTNAAMGAEGGLEEVGAADAAKTAAPTEEPTPAPENTPPETGTKGPEEPTPTNAPTNEPGKPVAQPGATESGVKPNPDAPATAPVRPVKPVLAPAHEAPPEAVPIQTPPVEQTPQAPVEIPAPEVAAPSKAPAIAPGQAASEAVAASPEQQAVVDEAPNIEPAYKRGTPKTVGEAATQAKLGVFNAPDETFSADNRVNNSAEPAPTTKTDIPSYIKKDPEAIIAKAKDDIAAIDKKLDSLGTGNNLKFRAKQDLAQQLKDHPNAKPAIIKGYQRKMGAYNESEVATTKNSLLVERQEHQSLINMAERAKSLPEDVKEEAAASPQTSTKETSIPKDTANVKFEKTENPLKSETPPPNPYGIEPVKGLDDETAAQGGTKAQLNEGDKLLSPRAQLSKVGAAGRQLLQLFRNKEFNAGRLTTAMENDTPTFHDLSPKDQATAAKVVRGEVTTDNPKINQAAQELQDHFKNVLQSARAAGIDAGDLGEKYIPQMKEAGYFDKASNIKKLIKTLVGKGYSEEQATQTVNRLRNDVRSRPNLAGHLELPREVEDPDQNFNSAKLRAYNEQAASRIAEAQHYGANNEEITKLHGKAAQNGEDVNQIKQITEDYMHPKAVSRGATSKIAAGVRGVTNVALLPKAALSHTFQGLANTGSDVGFTKYFKALGNRVFSSDEKDFIGESGIKQIAKQESSPLDKATAPGLKQLRSFHQQVAVLAGKYHADALAAKGDEAGLREIGVTGDLTKGEDGKIPLTRTQQLQAGKVESDKSIFSDSSLETSKALKGNTGKAIGQFRTAYVAKQGGRIIDLVKQARNGDVAPLLRYLAVGAPVAGAGTLALKNLYKTGNPNPFPSGTSKTSDVLNVAQNSGIETPALGLPESAINAVRYNYNNNDRINNAAGAVSPIAGIATEAGQNIDQALRGNDKPLIKQGASYVPLPKVGSMIDKKYAPTKPISSDEQKFFKAYGPALQKLNNTVNPFNKSATNQNTRVTDLIKSLTSNDHNAQGQSIQKSPAETQAQWGTISGLPPDAQNAYVNFQKSLPNHSPAYDLTGNGTVIDKNGNQSAASKFQVYTNYEKELPGSAERSQLESLNPWLTKTFAAEQVQFNSSASKGTSVPYNGPLPGGLTLKDLQYPTIPPAINDLMNQATALSSIPAASRTADQETQLKNIESNPDLQSAYSALDTYTNNQRVARGAPPLKLAPNASPAVQAGINAYDALPASKSGGNTDSTTSGERSAWIKANPSLYAQMQNYYAGVDLANVSKGGAQNELEGNSPSQSFLSGIKGEGADILSTKNANGTTSYSINPAAADAASYGSGSGSTSASGAAYERDKAAGLSDNGSKYSTKADDKGLKAGTTKYTPPKLLADTVPTGKNGNPFVQAITNTKGVKQRKGGDNVYAANISNSKGVKTA